MSLNAQLPISQRNWFCMDIYFQSSKYPFPMRLFLSLLCLYSHALDTSWICARGLMEAEPTHYHCWTIWAAGWDVKPTGADTEFTVTYVKYGSILILIDYERFCFNLYTVCVWLLLVLFSSFPISCHFWLLFGKLSTKVYQMSLQLNTTSFSNRKALGKMIDSQSWTYVD